MCVCVCVGSETHGTNELLRRKIGQTMRLLGCVLSRKRNATRRAVRRERYLKALRVPCV